jgi:hypothetical protein
VGRSAPAAAAVRQGGNGLNLQAAQHVVFLEPLLDSGEEAQAMGRIDCVGQAAAATHVHRYVVARSVEENVYRLGARRAARARAGAGAGGAAAARRGARAGGELTVRDVAALLRVEGGRGSRGGAQAR